MDNSTVMKFTGLIVTLIDNSLKLPTIAFEAF